MNNKEIPHEQTSSESIGVTNTKYTASSRVYQLKSSWTGFSSLRYLFIFGDSYSDVGYSTFRRHVPPSEIQPLGIEFPGTTYNEEGLPNWVGHLISKYRPNPCFDPSKKGEQDPGYMQSPLLVYDYAIGGQTVRGVCSQVENMFFPDLESKLPKAAVPWNASNSLFITWVGINDCGIMGSNVQKAIEELFVTQERLYQSGARNFLYIDVPPIHRSPVVSKIYEETSAYNYLNWNTSLAEALEEFSKNHNDASMFLFSSFDVFERVLDKPKDFGIKEKEVRKTGGAVWVDHLHPTSKMHDILASSLAGFLGQIQ